MASNKLNEEERALACPNWCRSNNDEKFICVPVVVVLLVISSTEVSPLIYLYKVIGIRPTIALMLLLRIGEKEDLLLN